MALFSRNDRIAIALLCAVIVAGWGWRVFRQHQVDREGIRVIQGAVVVPRALDPVMTASDSVGALRPLNGGVSFPAEQFPIDLNTADISALESLPLIGVSRAKAIIAWRTEHGPFRRIEDIVAVPGIGPGILERIRDRVTVSTTSPPLP